MSNYWQKYRARQSQTKRALTLRDKIKLTDIDTLDRLGFEKDNDSNDLIISIDNNKRVIIKSYFEDLSNNAHRVKYLEFSNGVTMLLEDAVQNVTVRLDPNTHTLSGTHASDQLISTTNYLSEQIYVNDYGSGFGRDTLYLHHLSDYNSERVGNDLVLGNYVILKDFYVYEDHKGRTHQLKYFTLGGNDILAADMLMDQYIDGTNESENVDGSVCHDILKGYEGNDLLRGHYGNDSLDGGKGDDVLIGGKDNDMYVFNDKHGHDIVKWDSSEDSTDWIVLNHIMNESELRFEKDNNNLIIHTSENDSITIDSYFLNHEYEKSTGQKKYIKLGNNAPRLISDIAKIVIDGTRYSDTINGTIARDIIDGQSGSDTINGGKGKDYLVGGYGSDTYVCSNSSEIDEIDNSKGERWTNSIDYIEFRDVSSIDDIIFDLDDFTKSLIVKTKNGDGFKILKYFGNDASKVERIHVGGKNYNLYDLVMASNLSDKFYELGYLSNGTYDTDSILGTDGRDNLLGTDGNDVFNSLKDDDYLHGGLGDDQYIFIANNGFNFIHEWSEVTTGNDRITLKAVGSIDELKYEIYSENALKIISNCGTEIYIPNYFVAQNFQVEQIEIRDGSIYNLNDLLKDCNITEQLQELGYFQEGYFYDNPIISTESDSTVFGTEGDDIIIGLGADDTLVGNSGSDKYIIKSIDYFATTIRDESEIGSDDIDTIYFEERFTIHDFMFGKIGNDLEMLTPYESPIIIKDYFYDPRYRVEQIELRVGGTYNIFERLKKSNIYHELLYGGFFTSDDLDDAIEGTDKNDNIVCTELNEAIFGLDGDDIIKGGSGDDFINGGQGSDTYLFSRGDGNDFIVDSGANDDDFDKIVFLDVNSFTELNVDVHRENTTGLIKGIIISLPSEDSITLTNYFSDPSSRVEAIELLNGEVKSLNQFLLESNIAEELISRGLLERDDSNEGDIINVIGTENSEEIYTPEENAIINGKGGDDIITLCGGQYEIQNYESFGNDIVKQDFDYFTTGTILSFDENIIDYAFEFSDFDLVISSIDEDKSVTLNQLKILTNWDVHFKMADYEYTQEGILRLINAMAVLSNDSGMSWQQGISSNNEDFVNQAQILFSRYAVSN